MELKNKTIIEYYLEETGLDCYDARWDLSRYCDLASRRLKTVNFVLFPTEKTVIRWSEDMIENYKFKCDLLVNDKNFWEWLIRKEIIIDQVEHLKTFETLKTFLELQEPTIIFPSMTRKEKDEFCDFIRIALLTGFEKTFWLRSSYKVDYIGFDIKNSKQFIFNNGKLDIETWTFHRGNYSLKQDTSINLHFPEEELKDLSLEKSLRDCLWIKSYISKENTISSIILWYMIAWIFRKEYKDKRNEFPFLWLESVTGSWKTSLLNFLSRICWYDWNTIDGVSDSDYAFEVWMNSMSWRFYFFDEIQKASAKLLKYIQISYNWWVNHKGWANWNWSKLQSYRKDCSLICTWELLPQNEEALLNRFIILNPSQAFSVKKDVTSFLEFEKYKSLTKDSDLPKWYLTTDQIKTMAIRYYRPRFLNILKNKKDINFNEYVDKAQKYIESVNTDNVDVRLLNNLSPALAGYLLVWWEKIGEQEIHDIIKDYLDRLQTYRKDSIVSSRIVEYIISHIGEFCNRSRKVKWQDVNYPMIYLKYSNKEQVLVMQIQSIVKYVKDKIDCSLASKHIEQQLRQLLWLHKRKSWAVKVAKWKMNMTWVSISLDMIKGNESLQLLRDSTLCYLWEHEDELIHISSWEDNQWHEKTPIQKCMASETLESLISEIGETYDNADFFNTDIYNKDNESVF